MPAPQTGRQSPHVFLINLDRSTDRLARCAPILDALGLTWERVPGIEGKKLPPEQLAALNPHPAPHGEWFRPLTPGEIGCFLSHLRCWQLIEERNLDCALVLEDERVQWVKVTLTKPGAVPNAAGVGVEILRHRTPAASAN